MKKIILMVAVAVSVSVALAVEYTYTTRIDMTSQPGTTYVGRAASDLPATMTNTIATLEEQFVWMIVRTNSTSVLHSGGSETKYNVQWTNRLNAIYK